jgi:hypothetical protein
MTDDKHSVVMIHTLSADITNRVVKHSIEPLYDLQKVLLFFVKLNFILPPKDP